jgi:hypothetical protein
MEPTRTASRIARALRAPGYLILSFLIVQSILDLLASASPLLPRLVAWRVRALGLTASSLTAPLLAFLLLYVLALASDHRVVLRILSVATALGTLALAAGSGIFALDVVQLGRSVPATEKSRYFVSALYALAKLGIGVLSLLLLTWVGYKAARTLKKEAAAASPKPNLLVRVRGTTPSATPAAEPAEAEPPVA